MSLCWPTKRTAVFVALFATLPVYAQQSGTMPDLRAGFDRALEQASKSVTRGGQGTAVGALPTGKGQLPASAMSDPREISRKIASDRAIDPAKTELMIFVSLSMPPSVLRSLAEQAKESGATLVLRGMKRASLKETRAAILDIGAHNANWMIQPGLFEAFTVKSVPTFVLANPQSGNLQEDGCAPESTFVSVAGVQSVEAALRQMARRGNTESSRMAVSKMQALGIRP